LLLQGLPGIFVEEDSSLVGLIVFPGIYNEFGVLLPPLELLFFNDAILWKLLVLVAAVNELVLLLLLLLLMGEFQLLDDFNPLRWLIFVDDDGVDTDLTYIGRLDGILLFISASLGRHKRIYPE